MSEETLWSVACRQESINNCELVFRLTGGGVSMVFSKYEDSSVTAQKLRLLADQIDSSVAERANIKRGDEPAP